MLNPITYMILAMTIVYVAFELIEWAAKKGAARRPRKRPPKGR